MVAMLSVSLVPSVVIPAIGQQPSATGAISKPELPSGRRRRGIIPPFYQQGRNAVNLRAPHQPQTRRRLNAGNAEKQRKPTNPTKASVDGSGTAVAFCATEPPPVVATAPKFAFQML